MNKICFLVSDEQTKTSITHTLWMYKKDFLTCPLRQMYKLSIFTTPLHRLALP